jgi:hypothetical protein
MLSCYKPWSPQAYFYIKRKGHKWFHLLCERCDATQFIKLGRLHVTYADQKLLFLVMHKWELWSLFFGKLSQDTSVGTMMGCRLDEQESIPGIARFFHFPLHPDWLWGPPTLLSNGYGGSFPEVKIPGCTTNHSPPSSAEVKNSEATVHSPLCLIN